MSVAAHASAHLVHGMGTSLEPAAWPPLVAREAAAVLAHFPDAGRFGAICWHSPRPFSSAALIETSGGMFLLKRHFSELRSVEGLHEEHRFIAHLRERGLAVPEVLQTDSGASALAYGDSSYEVHRVSPGADLYRDSHSWMPFFSEVHAFQAGVALARLHRAAVGFEQARGPYPLVGSFTIVPAADWSGAAEIYVAERPALAGFLAGVPWRDTLARLFARWGRGLAERVADAPVLWTHNDWHPSNLLWDADGRVATIFDFGLAAPSFALQDLAMALERCAVPWLALPLGPGAVRGEVAQARALFAGYRSVLPLSPEDVATVAALLPLVHVEFALTEIDYFAGILGDPAQAMLAWQDYLVGHADWFETPEGAAFLGALVEG